jgi:hypothetical protein
MTLLSKIARFFRGAPPTENATPLPPNNLGGLFGDMLFKQQAKQQAPKSKLRGPQGEVYDPRERSPLDPSSP